MKIRIIEYLLWKKYNMSLTQKVIYGGSWIFALRISRRVLDFLRTVILAKFLAPHDFGLMGIAILTLQTLEAFSQTGFPQLFHYERLEQYRS